jgi:uncharacterized protein (DUF169 family)
MSISSFIQGVNRMDLVELHQIVKELEEVLRLQSFPLAVKMVKVEGEIPQEASRPVKDLGHHLSTCQLFAIARRQGITLAQLKEDMWCVQPVVGYGLAQAPDYFMNGKDRFTDSARTPEAGKAWVRGFPRFPVGEYIGVVAAPARVADFEPDLIMIYCDPCQLTQLLSAKNWLDGLDIESKLSGHAACVYAIVPTIKSGNWQVTVPCPGDRAMGLARHDEMIVSIPTTGLSDAVTALVYARDHGQGLPLAPLMSTEYKLEEPYLKTGRKMGMEWLS